MGQLGAAILAWLFERGRLGAMEQFGIAILVRPFWHPKKVIFKDQLFLFLNQITGFLTAFS